MALQPASQIWWGPGLESVIDFDHPTVLDDVRHWRRPAPGSARARNPAGTTDAAVYGYDYLLAGRARWFDSGRWSNPTGLQAFIDWAGQGNVFRFVPDKDVPDFYVDNVTLDEPFDDPAPDLEQADGSQSVDLVIRNSTVPFGQALRGIMFEYAPGASITDPVAATFTRATAATFRGKPGNLAAAVGASAASGVLRDRHYEGTLRTTLLEAARTQRVTDPENFGAWSANLCTRNAGESDPFGGTAAYQFVATGADAHVFLVVGFTGDGTKSIAVFVRVSDSTICDLSLNDDTAGAVRHRVRFNVNTGVLSTQEGAGTLFTAERFGFDWWRVSFGVNGVVAANTNVLRLRPDPVGSTLSTRFFGANAWDATVPSSYQGPSLATRNQDALSWAHPYRPQPVMVYVKFVERGDTLTNFAGVVALSLNEESGDPTLVLRSNAAAAFQFVHSNGATNVVIDSVSGLAFGQGAELLGLLNPDGSVSLKQSIAEAAETSTGPSGALSFGASWPTLRLNGNGTFWANVGFIAIARVKIGPLTFAGVTRDTITKARDA